TGFALNTDDVLKDFPGLAFSSVGISAKWFFEFVFCAVSLAVVWGTTLERIKFGVYAIYAIVFSAIIYPLIAHWLFAFGWLAAERPERRPRQQHGHPLRRHRRGHQHRRRLRGPRGPGYDLAPNPQA